MKKEDLVLEIAADPKLMQPIRGLIRCYVGSLGFSEDRTDDIVLAVDEACTNIIRHSYGYGKGRSFRLSLTTTPKYVQLDLHDNGRPAPRASVRPPSDGGRPDSESLKPGGLGVKMIYEVFDKVTYRPGRTRGNHIVLKLKRPDSPVKSKKGC